MTTEEALGHMRENTALNRARNVFSSYCGRIDQESRQGLLPIDMRRLEFEAVQKIAEIMKGTAP